MAPVARESYRGALRVRLYQRRGGRASPRVLVLDATSSQACVEVGGLPWRPPAREGASRSGGGDDDDDRRGVVPASWRGKSQMAEPLRSIAFNLELERWAADRLQQLQALPFVDFPGL